MVLPVLFSVVGLILVFVVLGISIASAVLASRKGRNPINWFFLSLLWGFVGLIILACSRSLIKERKETDTLSIVLWVLVLVPLISFSIFYYEYNKQRPIKEREAIESIMKFKYPDGYEY